MNNLKRIMAAAVAASCLPYTFAFAAPAPEERVTVIVEVRGDAVLEAEAAQKMGAQLFIATDDAADIEGSIRKTQAAVQSDIIKKVDQKAEVGYTYTHVFNGFSMEVNASDIAAIKTLPNVENVYISHVYELHDEPEAKSGMYLDPGCEMMHAGYMHDAGYTGKGTVIAVIDSGFDPSHEIFQGAIDAPKLSKADIADKIENEKLSIDSIGGNVTVNRVYRSEKIPYAYNYYTKNSDTYDVTNDHGQHVAGIAAGNNGTDPQGGKFVGTAPDAQLLLMGCGETNFIHPEAEIAAIDDAVKLGADAINLSFGTDYREDDESEKKAINNAVRAGILFSTSAGNSSRGYRSIDPLAKNIDYSSSGTPDSFTAATSVASVDNNNVWQICYRMMVDGEYIYFSDGNKSISFAESFSDRQYDFIYAGFGTEADFDGLDAEGRIAVINKGAITLTEKVENTKNSGAIGIVLINDAKTFNFSMNQYSVDDMPCAGVSLADAERLTGAAEMKLQTDPRRTGIIISSENYAMSGYSSWGVNSTLELKPEITAPGGKIYSSVYDNEYGNMSGTSMAAPHMTGAAAVMVQYINEHPEKFGTDINKVQLIENLIMTSADVLMQDKENNIPYSPRLQGAGLINLEKAAKTPVTLIGDTYTVGGIETEKSKISLKEIDDTFNIEFTARNLTDTDVEYDSIEMTVMTDGADEYGYVSDMRTLTFNAELPESVTVPANSEIKVSVPVSLDNAELSENMEVFKNGFFVDGFVFLDSSDDDIPEISIPFTGFYGDWAGAPALDTPYLRGKSICDSTYMYYYTHRQSNGRCVAADNMEIAGQNLFVVGYYKDWDEYDSEDFVGYSPNGDGFADDPYAVLMPLRRLGRTDFSICDAEGKELFTRTDTQDDKEFYCDKFRETHLFFDKGSINELPDGDYIFKVKTGFIGRDPYEQNESIDFRFYIDREKPVITRFEKSGDGNELTVAATDNRHIMGFVLSGTIGGDAITISCPIKGLNAAEHTFDIEYWDEGSITVEAVDYAQNSALRSEKELEFSLSEKTGASFLFAADNRESQTINAALTLALYKEGRLVGIASKNDLIPEGKSYHSFNVSSNAGYDSIKRFVWDSLRDMKPLYNVFDF